IGVFYWPFTQETDSYAVFGQVDYKFTDRLTATVGLRYSSDDKSFKYDGLYSSDVGGPQIAIPYDDGAAIRQCRSRSTRASRSARSPANWACSTS
ncbi:MAG: TonB-dependent receptor, partial [Hyphomonadaceae bacterium]